jgi:hypothetical protein
MARVGFEPMIPVFEPMRTFRALDRLATVIGPPLYEWPDPQHKELTISVVSMHLLMFRAPKLVLEIQF